MKDDLVYLDHILDCITKIEEYTKGGRAAFVADTMIQDAVMRNLEIIGEATKNLPLEYRNEHAEVDWRGAMALRNVLIHNYISINVPRVWTVVTRKLPRLKAQITALRYPVSDEASGP